MITVGEFVLLSFKVIGLCICACVLVALIFTALFTIVHCLSNFINVSHKPRKDG